MVVNWFILYTSALEFGYLLLKDKKMLKMLKKN